MVGTVGQEERRSKKEMERERENGAIFSCFHSWKIVRRRRAPCSWDKWSCALTSRQCTVCDRHAYRADTGLDQNSQTPPYRSHTLYFCGTTTWYRTFLMEDAESDRYAWLSLPVPPQSAERRSDQRSERGRKQEPVPPAGTVTVNAVDRKKLIPCQYQNQGEETYHLQRPAQNSYPFSAEMELVVMILPTLSNSNERMIPNKYVPNEQKQ